ncbi:MAG: hypothetical protein CBD02_00010 [Candidatus Pelagibacter sp. TMED142]|nr:MAG: hypothetical protein CBD02_00010 [Candidatus Pelagibacter sp. TMED142]|tara:strand:- start:1616 stop:4195 length:2580 start_codon:yes stop_codon:yes gene_type:complete
MADKTPVRVVFNSSNVATGMAEFQTGETVPVANGGTGLASLGSAGQVLRTNAAGNALEFATLEDLADIISVGSTLTAPSNADFNITTAGTGNIVLNDLSISDNTLSTNRSNDDLNINASGTGTVILENLKIGTSGSTVTTILDEDNMSTNSATALATQQSIKAYVDSEVGAVSTTAISQLNSNVTVADAGSGTITVTVDGSTIGTFNASGLQLGGSGARVTTVLDEDGFGTNSDTALATQQSIKAYVDAQITAEDLDVTADDSTAIAIDLDSEVLHFAGGNGISTSVSGNTVTTAIDTGTVVTLTDSQTLTNKVLTNPTINAFSGTGNGSITGTLSLVTTTTDDSFLITTTEDSNSAAPVITFKRNSSSPADADYLGRIKFKGENDADQEVQYGSISGKILDASDGTEDGAIEFNVKKAGSNNIAMRINSDELKLLNGTGIDVDGTSVLDGVTITDNTISTNESNSPLELKANGTGAVKVVSGGVTFTLPTTDGSDGDFLKTDGSGALSFASSTTTASDDTRAVVKNNKSVGSSARTIDYFQATSADAAFYFVALNDLTNDHSSASIFTVAHNNSDAFIGAPRGGASGTANTLPSTTADISSDQVRVKVTAPSADSKLSYYKIPLSRANTSDATSGVTVTTSNTDVDSASESIDTFAHASFRAAKYVILVDNDSKTETGVVEALVVHNGSDAFITQYGDVNTGSNQKIVLSAAISGSNVVVSAAGNEPNLSLKIHKTLLSDSMTAVSNSNQKIIGATTVSSSATAFDDFDLDDATAAVYYVVGGNSSEGAFSVQEVYCAGAPGEASVSQGPFVSTKGTTQLNFTAAFKSDADNSLQLSVASTSGGSTTVNAYRINCLAE